MQPAHRDTRVYIQRMVSQARPSLAHPNKIEERHNGRYADGDGRYPRLAAELHSTVGEAVSLLWRRGQRYALMDTNTPLYLQSPQVLYSITSTSDFQPTLPQLDGPQDYRPQMVPAAFRSRITGGNQGPSNTLPSAKPPNRTPKTAISDLLPYCTAELPLTQDQVIGLSDIAGNIKEVMLLALHARVDEGVARNLVRAVGQNTAKGIVDFFRDEFEVGAF